MTFAAIAQLISGQRPFYLYRFKRAGVETLFTSLPSDLTRSVAGVAGTLWTAIPISHSRIPYATDSARSEFPITLPLSNTFARSFLAPVGLQLTTLRIWKGFQNDADSELVVQYNGGVLAAQPRSGGTIVLSCMGDIAGLRRKGLTGVLQRPCRHALYHDGCGVSLASRQVVGTVGSITTDGRTITVSAASAQADKFYAGGIFEFAGLQEMIQSHAGSTLRLASPVPGLVDAFAADGPQACKIAPGCTLTRGVCQTRFDNLDNFGGFPWLSTTPFDGRSIV